MVFLDSGFLIALVVKNDQYHSAADEKLKELIRDKVRLYISNYVLQETITRIVYAGGARFVKPFVKVVDELTDDGLLNVIWVDRNIHDLAVKTLYKYSDHPFSLVDASIIALVKHLKLGKIYSTDASLKRTGLEVVVLGY